MDLFILARRPDLVVNLQKNRTCSLENFAILIKECETINKYLELVKELKEGAVEHKDDADANLVGALGTVPKV